MSLLQSSSLSRTDFCAAAALPQLRCCLTAWYTTIYESESWTETLSPSYSPQHTLKYKQRKAFAISGCSVENHIYFSTIWYNMIPSHYKMQDEELSTLVTNKAEQSFLPFKYRGSPLVNGFLIITQSHYLNRTFPFS